MRAGFKTSSLVKWRWRAPKCNGFAAFLVALTLVFTPTTALAGPKFIEACQRLLKIYFRQPEFVEQRAKEFLPGIHQANRESWKRAVAMPPEKINGLTLEDAMLLLSKLKKGEDASQGGSKIRNATFVVPVGKGQAAIVKHVFTRSELGESKVTHVTNNVKYEVVAFMLDRFLGTNLVPPTIMLGPTTVAQLRINAGSVSASGPAKKPEALLEMTHVRLLDVLMGNGDRGFSENMLEVKVKEADGREITKEIGIDFDLSRPMSMFPVEAAEFSLAAQDLLLEPTRRMGKHGYSPGVFSASVVEKLRALNEAKILELAEQNGITVSRLEIQSILAGRSASLAVIDGWIARYGSELILVP